MLQSLCSVFKVQNLNKLKILFSPMVFQPSSALNRIPCLLVQLQLILSCIKCFALHITCFSIVQNIYFKHQIDALDKLMQVKDGKEVCQECREWRFVVSVQRQARQYDGDNDDDDDAYDEDDKLIFGDILHYPLHLFCLNKYLINKFVYLTPTVSIQFYI